MSAETDLVAEHSTDPVGMPAGSSEGCPPPLGWAQVLDEFRAQSEPWTVSIAGTSVRGRTLGRGRPLYFLNGFAGTSDLFCLMVWLLRDEFRCVVFDYPATAEGPKNGSPLTADSLATLIFEIADSQRDETFSLFATSFGSVVALAALAADPRRIDRAILLNGFAHRDFSLLERLLSRAGRFLTGTLTSVPFRAAIHRANHEHYFPPFDHGRWAFSADNMAQTPIRDLAERVAVAEAFDCRPRLAQIEQPVLLVRTEYEGHVSAACQEELAGGLPHATIEMLHTTGPLAYLTHPHRLAKVVRTFLVPVGSPTAESTCVAGSDCINDSSTACDSRRP